MLDTIIINPRNQYSYIHFSTPGWQRTLIAHEVNEHAQEYKYEITQNPDSSNHPRSKTKEYSADVQRMIIELLKLESGCKKRAKALQIQIFTIRVIRRSN